MGKTNVNVCKQQIGAELRRWLTKSKQIRINSHISYGKIKANLSALALMTSKEDIRAFSNEIGIKLVFSKILLIRYQLIIMLFINNFQRPRSIKLKLTVLHASQNYISILKTSIKNKLQKRLENANEIV